MNYSRHHSGVREGLIPTALGTAVTAGAIAARCIDIKQHHGMKRRDVLPMVETAIIGFGLAHIVLGAIDLLQD